MAETHWYRTVPIVNGETVEPVSLVACYPLRWGNGDPAEVALVEADEEHQSVVNAHERGACWCLYCGQQYPATSEIPDLREHIKVCPEHPLAKAIAALRNIERLADTGSGLSWSEALEIRETAKAALETVKVQP